MDTIAGLQKKEVINVHDGTRLGYVSDVDIDLENGKILALHIPASTKMFNIFGKNEDHVIPWDQITKIGDDIILIT